MSLEQTANAIGRSVSMTCQLRNHAHASLAQEATALDQVLADASSGGIVIIPRLLPAFEAALGKKLNLSTLYRMLARHGWRKLAPDTVHPQGDSERREDFKKNSAPTWRKL